jgi:hypothetical protein
MHCHMSLSWWIVDWKGYERKRSGPVVATVQTSVWGGIWGKPRNISMGIVDIPAVRHVTLQPACLVAPMKLKQQHCIACQFCHVLVCLVVGHSSRLSAVSVASPALSADNGTRQLPPSGDPYMALSPHFRLSASSLVLCTAGLILPCCKSKLPSLTR